MQNFMKNSDELPYINMILDFLINGSFFNIRDKTFAYLLLTRKISRPRNLKNYETLCTSKVCHL